MAATTHTGVGPLTPFEVSFLAENDMITIVPRQRLESLDLISGHIPAFRPPQRATIPLWLALVLKKQKRCNIVPPTWLTAHNLDALLTWETEHPQAFSSSLPYRWLETSEILLSAAADDIPDGEGDLRVLLRGLREVRQTKARMGLKQLESTYLQMNGLGLLEITELRGFAGMVTDGLRRLGATREEGRRAEEEEDDGDEEDESQTTSRYGASTVGRSMANTSTVGRSSLAVRGSTNTGRSSVDTFDNDEDDF
ncbi:hypothetical protein BZA05DRAFT_402759 [Tricharina praecox]|uniref:uncharacterized protein n=1 Tax=Tricharina praecox TaxID=43433 RepID=UPI002220F23F|nr:uncharacterized protein BZA05DRAFT_402759 [Tricharina praecox]KAI5848805.1 hypothetical protein BZA05DRAFT_402759 [Tricharina praecox]